MSAAAQLGNLLGITADLNYYTMLLNAWAAKYEANSEKLQKQVKYEEKWENAKDDAIDNSRDLSVYQGGVLITVGTGNTNVDLAEQYADAKVSQFDEELSIELAELDIDYDTMKTLYEALCEELKAEKDADKQSTATACQDTHLLQS